MQPDKIILYHPQGVHVRIIYTKLWWDLCRGDMLNTLQKMMFPSETLFILCEMTRDATNWKMHLCTEIM